jgi:DeoR family transcriptional regulator, fructose operon transcriptional repressor
MPTRLFLEARGINLSHGHSTPNPLDAEVKQAMMRSADETYVLADSTNLVTPVWRPLPIFPKFT